MNQDLLNASRVIERQDNRDDVFQTVLSTLENYGFTHCIYVTVANTPTRELDMLTNFPEEWAAGMKQDETAFDPFLEYCCSTYEITLTGVEFVEDYPYLDEKSVGFIKAAGEIGFRSGLGIPMRLQNAPRYGGFNLGTGMKRADFERAVLPKSEMIRTFCLFAHRRINELSYNAPSTMTQKALSPREKQCITLLAAGLRAQEIADNLSLSIPAVRLYIRNARNKLGANTKEQAIVIAMQKGFISEGA